MEDNLNEIINTLGVKLANLEIQNAALIVENNRLKAQVENKEEDENVKNK